LSIKRTKNTIRILGIVLAFACAILATFLFLLNSEYSKPPELPVDNNEVSRYLTHSLAPEFFNGINKGDKFTLRIHQSGFCDILNKQQWPLEIGKILIKWAKLEILDGKIRIICSIEAFSIDTTFRTDVSTTIDNAGKMQISLSETRAGKLPANFLINKMLKKYYSTIMDAQIVDSLETKLLESIIEGKKFSPKFDLYGRSIVIEKITAEKNLLTVVILPVQNY